MECSNCKIEMKLTPKSISGLEIRIDRTSIPYIRIEGNQCVPQINTYVCPNCGLIQQYISEEGIKCLNKS